MERNSTNGTPKQLSAESQSVFREGVNLVLSRWSALRMAVENEWGGRGSRQLADQLASDVFSWFSRSNEPLYIDDLEDILDEGMNSLNTDVDDGSIEEVAEKLMILHGECLEGNYNCIEKLRKEGPVAGIHEHVRQTVDDDDDSDDDDDDNMDDDDDDGANMVVDAPKSRSLSNTISMSTEAPMSNGTHVEDGWEVVTSRRNRGKRN